jgi:hypothetical protein
MHCISMYQCQSDYLEILNAYNMFVCLFDGAKATFNNSTVISWRSVLLVEENGGPGKNHRPVVIHQGIY